MSLLRVNNRLVRSGGKLVRRGSPCRCCGGGAGGDWPLDTDPNGPGVYLVAQACPGGPPLTGRVLVFIPAGTPQPTFDCTAIAFGDTCVSIGNTSAVATRELDDSVITGVDLSRPTGTSCCGCVPGCGTSTIEYYRGADFCTAPRPLESKSCCCGNVKHYRVYVAIHVEDPVLVGDGNGNLIWRTNVTDAVYRMAWVADGTDIVSCSGTLKESSESWGSGPSGPVRTTTNNTTDIGCPNWAICSPWGVGLSRFPGSSDPTPFDGLECWQIGAGSGFTPNCLPVERLGVHDCKEHSGYVLKQCKGPAPSGLPAGVPDYVYTYQFTSTLESPDGGCGGGCQGGSNTPLGRSAPLGRSTAERIRGAA